MGVGKVASRMGATVVHDSDLWLLLWTSQVAQW